MYVKIAIFFILNSLETNLKIKKGIKMLAFDKYILSEYNKKAIDKMYLS